MDSTEATVRIATWYHGPGSNSSSDGQGLTVKGELQGHVVIVLANLKNRS